MEKEPQQLLEAIQQEEEVQPIVPQENTIVVKPESSEDLEEKIASLRAKIDEIKEEKEQVEHTRQDFNFDEDAIPERIQQDLQELPNLEEELQKFEAIKKHQSQEHSNGIKKWLKRTGIAALFSLASLGATGQKQEGGNNKQIQKIEAQSREKTNEDFLKYVDYLKTKNDTSVVTADDMEGYLEKFGKGKTLDVHSEQHKKEVLKSIYDKSSPYSLDGKKVQLPNLIPGYDLEFGSDKEDRILLNRILTAVEFDVGGGLTTYIDMPGYGKVLAQYDIDFKKDFGNKIIQGSVAQEGLMALLNAQIIEKSTGKVLAETVIGGHKDKKVNQKQFINEFTALLNN